MSAPSASVSTKADARGLASPGRGGQAQETDCAGEQAKYADHGKNAEQREDERLSDSAVHDRKSGCRTDKQQRQANQQPNISGSLRPTDHRPALRSVHVTHSSTLPGPIRSTQGRKQAFFAYIAISTDMTPSPAEIHLFNAPVGQMSFEDDLSWRARMLSCAYGRRNRSPLPRPCSVLQGLPGQYQPWRIVHAQAVGSR